MADIIPRYTLQVVVKNGGEYADTGFHFSVPTTQPVPMPGDEISIPKAVAEKNNLKSVVLKIESRRFVLDNLPNGITGYIYLACEEVPELE